MGSAPLEPVEASMHLVIQDWDLSSSPGCIVCGITGKQGRVSSPRICDIGEAGDCIGGRSLR